MHDGVGTSINNTRVLAARQAVIDVQARVRAFDEPLTNAEKLRFTRDGGGVPNTWGEATQMRIQAQEGMYSKGTFSQTFPNGSLYDPKVTGKK